MTKMATSNDTLMNYKHTMNNDISDIRLDVALIITSSYVLFIFVSLSSAVVKYTLVTTLLIVMRVSDSITSLFSLYFFKSTLVYFFFFFFNDPAPPEIYPLPLHDALPIWLLAFKNGNEVRLLPRNRLPQHLPAIADAVRALPPGDAILDGELTWDSGTYHLFDVL